jgi:hypothetical protein
LIFVALLLALLGLVPTAIASTGTSSRVGRKGAVQDSGSTTILPYEATGYRYMQVASGQGPAGWQSPSFDDSRWGIGDAAFGSGGGCPLEPTVKTHWDSNTDMLIRKSIALPAGTTRVTVGIAVDNDVYVYWNGSLIGSERHEFCPGYDDFSFSVPDNLLGGTNLLAVRGIDRGDQTFLDVTVKGDVPLYQPDHAYNWDKWSLMYGVSPTEGLVVGDVALGQRLMAERMGVDYLNLTTCAGLPPCIGFSVRHIVLQPDADETSANGGLFTEVRLVSQPPPSVITGGDKANHHTSISATYRVWLGPPASLSSDHLDITQTYSFYQDFTEAALGSAESCEPTQKLGDCARFKAEVSYQFFPGAGSPNNVDSLEAAERLHFTPDGLALRAASLLQDCNVFPNPICSDSLGNTVACDPVISVNLPHVVVSPVCVWPWIAPEKNVGDFLAPIPLETAVAAAYTQAGRFDDRAGIVDNIHETADEGVALPSDGSFVDPTAGCDSCVHIHGRWGAAVCSRFPQFKPCGAGKPLLCDTPGEPWPAPYSDCNATQNLDGALVPYHSEQVAGVDNFETLLPGADFTQLNQGTTLEGTQGNESLIVPPGACYDQSDLLSWGQCGVVTWLDDTAFSANTGTLFTFGGFFCADPGCKSADAYLADKIDPTYLVAGQPPVALSPGQHLLLSPGQQYSIELTAPMAQGETHFFADLLPPGSTNVQVTDPYNLCGTPFTDGSGLTAVKCEMPAPACFGPSCILPTVTITANAPMAAGRFTNYVRAVWGLSTTTSDVIQPLGGNYRKADTICVSACPS